MTSIFVIVLFVFQPLYLENCLFVFFLFSAEVQAIASLIEKQAQIVVKQKEVSEEAKKRKEALLAQYAHITDEEEYPFNTFCNDVTICNVVFLWHFVKNKASQSLSQGQGLGDPA